MPIGEKKKIYIVDDDEVLLNMYTIKFRSAGFDVEVSKDSLYALEKLRAGLTPDVLLLDVVMPGTDGIELLENIRKEGLVSNAVVLILSNQSAPEDIERAKNLKVDGFIVKATTIPSEVVIEVQNAMKAHAK
ncbi:MAG TPA: response regulator [Candidatus Paceibacterota bacterium]